MNLESDNVFILSSNELMVLLAGKDIKNAMALQETEIELDQNAVCKAMSHLYEQKFIYNHEGVFCLDKDLDYLINGIKDAKRIHFFRNTTKSKYIKVIYQGEELVCLEQSNIDAAALKIFKIQEEEIKDMILTDFLDSQKSHQVVLDEENVRDRVLKEKKTLTKRYIEQLPNTLGIIETINCASGKVDNRILLLQEKEKKSIFYYNREEILSFPFNDEKFDKLIENILWGETL